MQELPAEILFMIFSHFSDLYSDLISCAQVNRTWHAVVMKFYVWHTARFYSFSTFMHFRDVLERIKWNKRQRARNNWRRIVMQSVNGNSKVNIDVTRANETESDDDDSQWTFDSCNSISFHSTFPYGACVKVLDLSNLQSKNKLTDYMLDSLFESLPNLIELGLYNCYTITDKLIKRLPSRCSKLRVLNVCGCSNLSRNCIKYINRILYLERLNIG